MSTIPDPVVHDNGPLGALGDPRLATLGAVFSRLQARTRQELRGNASMSVPDALRRALASILREDRPAVEKSQDRAGVLENIALTLAREYGNGDIRRGFDELQRKFPDVLPFLLRR